MKKENTINIIKKLSFLLIIIILFGLNIEVLAYSKSNFKNYKPKVEGFENRLTLNNILKLTSMPSAQAKDLLLKAGWKYDKESQALVKEDFYAHDSDVVLYMAGFKEGTKGIRKLLIFTQPEMRIIQSSFLAGGYSETRVVPRKGARWTKVYQKKGFPTYSISMLLMDGMVKNALNYSYDEYVYCLICEKNI